MGIPLLVQPLDPGDPEAGQGYGIPRERYELPTRDSSPRRSLHCTLPRRRCGWTGTEATQAIWKLGGVEVGLPAPTVGQSIASLPGSEHLAALFAAATERRVVAFGYRGETRHVDPWRLNFATGSGI